MKENNASTSEALGVDRTGRARSLLTNERGALIPASTAMGGDQQVAERFLACRGVNVDEASSKLFTLLFSGTGSNAQYNSTTGMYELLSGTASGGWAAQMHNDVAFYVEGFPVGGIITTSLSDTTSTNKRIEWAYYGGVASSNVALQTVDAIGFYLENGTFGVFYRNAQTSPNNYPSNTVNIAQSNWNDPLNGSGRSGLSFSVADLLNQTFLEVNYVWLGSNGIRWSIGGVLVHELDFRWGAQRIAKPFSRVPHVRPGVYSYNSGAVTSTTVYVNCLSGFRGTHVLPKSQQIVVDRPTPRTNLASNTEVPFAAFRINSAGLSKARQFYPEWARVRGTAQNIRVRAYWGLPADFSLTGDNFIAVPSNPGSGLQYSITDMGWTPTYTNLQRIPGDLILPAATETSDINLEHAFAASEEWIGINGDGTQRYLVFTAEALAGSNGTIELTELHGRVMG